MRFIDGVRELIEVDGKDFTALRKAAKSIASAIRDVDYGRGYYQPEQNKVIWSLGDAAERTDGSDKKITGDYLRSFFQDAGVDAEIDVQPEGRPRTADGPGWFQFWPDVEAVRRPGNTDVSVTFESLTEGWYQLRKLLPVESPLLHWTTEAGLLSILRDGEVRQGKNPQVSLTRMARRLGAITPASYIGLVFDRERIKAQVGRTIPRAEPMFRAEAEEALPPGVVVPAALIEAILVPKKLRDERRVARKYRGLLQQPKRGFLKAIQATGIPILFYDVGTSEWTPLRRVAQESAASDFSVTFESLTEGWYQIRQKLRDVRDPRIHWTWRSNLAAILRAGRLKQSNEAISLTRSGEPIGTTVPDEVGFVFDRDELRHRFRLVPFRDKGWADEAEEQIQNRDLPLSYARAVLLSTKLLPKAYPYGVTYGGLTREEIELLKGSGIPVYVIEFKDAVEWGDPELDLDAVSSDSKEGEFRKPRQPAKYGGRFGRLSRVRESAASDFQQKASREIAAALKQGRPALDALRRISDADILRAADETPEADTPEARAALAGKAKDRVDPTKMGSVRDEIEKRFQRLAAGRGTETAKRAIAHLVGALPDADDEDAAPDVINAIAGAADAQQRTSR